MSAPFAGFCVRGLLSVLFSRAMENLTAEINHDFPGSMQVSDHGWWFSYFSNVDWLTQQCRSIHNNNKKIVLIGHSFGGTAAIIVTQQLNAMDIPVELLCPVDPAAQYTTVITPNAKRVVGFYQTNSRPAWAGHWRGQRLDRRCLERTNAGISPRRYSSWHSERAFRSRHNLLSR